MKKLLERKKQIIYKGKKIPLTADLLSATLDDRRQQVKKIFKVVGLGGNCEPRILWPAKFFFKNETDFFRPTKRRLYHSQTITGRITLQRIYVIMQVSEPKD